MEENFCETSLIIRSKKKSTGKKYSPYPKTGEEVLRDANRDQPTTVRSNPRLKDETEIRMETYIAEESTSKCYSKDEIKRLYLRARKFCQDSAFKKIPYLYRCKSKPYWDNIQSSSNAMIPCLHENHGHDESPINKIPGTFFSSYVEKVDSPPITSMYGERRFKMKPFNLLNPDCHNFYFCNFFCRTQQHYVTIVVTKRQHITDMSCNQMLQILNPAVNPFFVVEYDQFNKDYSFYVTDKAIVEFFYTENVNLSLGIFDNVMFLPKDPGKINLDCSSCNLNLSPNIEEEDLMSTEKIHPHATVRPLFASTSETSKKYDKISPISDDEMESEEGDEITPISDDELEDSGIVTKECSSSPSASAQLAPPLQLTRKSPHSEASVQKISERENQFIIEKARVFREFPQQKTRIPTEVKKDAQESVENHSCTTSKRGELSNEERLPVEQETEKSREHLPTSGNETITTIDDQLHEGVSFSHLESLIDHATKSDVEAVQVDQDEEQNRELLPKSDVKIVVSIENEHQAIVHTSNMPQSHKSDFSGTSDEISTPCIHFNNEPLPSVEASDLIEFDFDQHIQEIVNDVMEKLLMRVEETKDYTPVEGKVEVSPIKKRLQELENELAMLEGL